MRRAGDDEVEGLTLPEEQVVQFRNVEQQGIAVESVLIIGVVGVGVVSVVTQGWFEDTAAVEVGGVVVEGFGAVAVCHQLGSDGLIEMVGHIVKHIGAGGGQINAGIETEFGVDGPGAAVAGGIEVGEVDALVHQTVEGGGILRGDGIVIHGLHQYQNDIFTLKDAGHFIGGDFAPFFEVLVYLGRVFS